MPPTSAQADKVRVLCPHCRTPFRVRRDLLGVSGPCKVCGETFTLAAAPARVRSPSARRPAAGPPAEGHGARSGNRTFFPQPAVYIAVALGFGAGLWIWLRTRASVQQFDPLGQGIVYGWWLVYPLVGYYLSLGWEAAGSPASRSLRLHLADLAIQISNMVIHLSCVILDLVGQIFKARRLGRAIFQLWSPLNRLGIELGTALLGRPASAFVLAVPHAAWDLVGRGRRVGAGGAMLMHLLGVVPALLVLFIAIVPLAELDWIERGQPPLNISPDDRAPGASTQAEERPETAVAGTGSGAIAPAGVDAAPPHAPETDVPSAGPIEPTAWAGAWRVDGELLQLSCAEDRITGTFSDGLGTIIARARGDRIEGTWQLGANAGTLDLRLARGANSFSGELRAPGKPARPWAGRRTTP